MARANPGSAGVMSIQTDGADVVEQPVDMQPGVVCRVDPQRRFGYVPTVGVGGARQYIYAAGQTTSHRTAAQLRLGSQVLVRVDDDKRIDEPHVVVL